MNLQNIQGMRMALFAIIFITAGLEALIPSVSPQTAAAITAIVAMLGIIKSFFPSGNNSGTIEGLD